MWNTDTAMWTIQVTGDEGSYLLLPTKYEKSFCKWWIRPGMAAQFDYYKTAGSAVNAFNKRMKDGTFSEVVKYSHDRVQLVKVSYDGTVTEMTEAIQYTA